MKRQLLVMVVFSLAMGLSACSDDDTKAAPSADVQSDTEQPDAGDDSGTGDVAPGDIDEGDIDEGEIDEGDIDEGDIDEGDIDEGEIDEGDAEQPSANRVTADDQVLEAAESNQVVVASATLEEDGFVVLYEECRDCLVPGPGEIIGHLAAPAGTHSDLIVTLARNAHHGEALYALLHEDTDADATFDFSGPGGPDGPLEAAGGEHISDDFVVSLPSLIADDTTLSDLSTRLTVSGAYSAGAGWVVISSGACADQGPQLGHAALVDGDNVNISVTLESPAQNGQTLCATLHTDTGVAGTFEYDSSAEAPEDVPVELADGSVVQNDFEVTVPDGTPAVRITLAAVTGPKYEVTSVEPDIFESGMTGSENPLLSLMQGWRYEIVNTDHADNPLEFIEKGRTDRVIFSQSSDGSGENDSDVNWVEAGNAVKFTTSGAHWSGGLFTPTVDGYRSANAKTSARGDVALMAR